MKSIVLLLSLVTTMTLSCKNSAQSPISAYDQRVAAADSAIKKIQSSALSNGYLFIRGKSINYCARFEVDQTCKIVKQFSSSGKLEAVGNGPCNLDTIGGSNDYLELNFNGRMLANVKTSTPYSGSDLIFQGQSEIWTFSNVNCLGGLLGDTNFSSPGTTTNPTTTTSPTGNGFSVNVTDHSNYATINKIGITWTLNAAKAMSCRIDGSVRAQVQKSSSSPIETKTLKYASTEVVTPGRSVYTTVEIISSFKILKLYSADLNFVCDGTSQSKFVSLL